MSHHFYHIFARLPMFFRILLMALTVILTLGIIVTFIEPETFHTIFDGIWWAIITASTVGYGDIVPQTTAGKITGIVLIFFGAGFLSAYLISLATSAVTRQTDFLEGKVAFKGKDHIVIIGWNERSREVIHKFLEFHYKGSIVLIDETLKKNPFSDYHVQFIQGRSHTDQTLLKANIEDASKVLITADQNRDELQADMNTILTLLAIKGCNNTVPCVVEVLTAEQAANAKRAGADIVIQSNNITSSVMLNSLKTEGRVESLLSLLEQLDGSRIVSRSSEPFINKKFNDASKILLEEDSILLGIKRGANTTVNPPPDFIIKDHDVLIVITPAS
ncbi:potassium channel family protein [Bacillus dakarensis]|uniref:potassium channel family protein n=1 Tax=Robertmurraya dakarensis TaxID=1926278 RepID=UPI000980FBE9|nr:potassium channel family protein [Bacillus dakarensis]